MNRDIILLRTLLLSTSQRNIYRHCSDKKKRSKIVGGFIGAALIYAMIMAYCIIMCIGYGAVGLIDATPVLCALVISLLAFLFTFFKAFMNMSSLRLKDSGGRMEWTVSTIPINPHSGGSP